METPKLRLSIEQVSAENKINPCLTITCQAPSEYLKQNLTSISVTLFLRIQFKHHFSVINYYMLNPT